MDLAGFFLRRSLWFKSCLELLSMMVLNDLIIIVLNDLKIVLRVPNKEAHPPPKVSGSKQKPLKNILKNKNGK